MTLQAKDIPEVEILAAMDAISPKGCSSRWDIEARLPAYPPKVVHARLRSMVKRKVIDAQCTCGCRGDYVRNEFSPWSGR